MTEKIQSQETKLASEWGNVEPKPEADKKSPVEQKTEEVFPVKIEQEKEAAIKQEEKISTPPPEKKEPEPAKEKKTEETEKKIAKESEKLEKAEQEASQRGGTVSTVAPEAAAAPLKSEVRVKIENILMEDLEDIFNSLDLNRQKEFKAKQEEVASKIERLIQTVRVKIKEVVQLIREFLKIIPGLNSFFAEQEAKIKTDKILDFKEKSEKQ